MQLIHPTNTEKMLRMNFTISGLPVKPFQHLFGQSDHDLAKQNVIRYKAEANSGFPDRIEMRHAAIGETVLLLNYQHQPAKTPYRASHAIFVLEGAKKTFKETNKIPEVLGIRPQSLRAFDKSGMLLEADLAEGAQDMINLIHRQFQNQNVAYIHTHNAKQGCYSGLIERAQ